MRRSRRLIEEPQYSEPDMLPILNICLMLILALISLSAFLPLGFISADAPRLSNANTTPSQKENLRLTLLLLDDGFQIVVNGKKQKMIPHESGAALRYDFSAMNLALAEVKKQYPNHEGIYIAASQNVQYVDIIHAMDAARVWRGGQAMFPKVAFAAGMTE